MSVSDTRVLIVGGGIAGPVLALFLQKAGYDVQIFEASAGPDEDGGALGLAPNGMNVLAAAGVIEAVRDVSVTSTKWLFENQKGQCLACVDPGAPRRYGQAGVLITRTALNRVLIKEAQTQRIPVHYGKRLLSIEDHRGESVIAHFADHTTAHGDFLVGADGIRSQVRQAVMPEAPKPTYTGLLAPGGFSPCLVPHVEARSPQPSHFLFGQKAFFGYFHIVTPEGPRTAWWSTAQADLMGKEERATLQKSDWQRRLLALHEDWTDPVPILIQSATEILPITIHDVPSLPRWSVGRSVLIGDAAHAVAPHSGQGASMALEDAMFLAKLLREAKGTALASVFEIFEEQRRPRTDKVIALGRRNGQRKGILSPTAYWLQQQMIRLVVPLTQGRKNDWLLSYKID